jgi:hypothetical protein
MYHDYLHAPFLFHPKKEPFQQTDRSKLTENELKGIKSDHKKGNQEHGKGGERWKQM